MGGGLDFISKYVMEEEMNIYNVVRYFVENSGMLFFCTKDDVKIAFDRICLIFNDEEKYFGEDITDKMDELRNYYNFFVNNFDEYSQREENKNLFDEIMNTDSNIVLCGSNYSLDLYFSNAKKQLQEANSSSFFLQRRYAVREGLRKIKAISKQINEYKSFYNLDIENNKVDEIMDCLGLNVLSKEEEIIQAYNNLFDAEYKGIVSTKNVDNDFLTENSNKLSYIRDVISNVYGLDSELEEMSLSDKYLHPLAEEPDYYEALRYFNLEPNCSKDVMVDTVERVIDDIMTTELMGKVQKTSNLFIDGANGNKDDYNNALDRANHFKDVLYNHFGAKRTITVKPVIKKQSSVNMKDSTDFSSSFSYLFNGLDYEAARRLYFSMMSNLLNSNNSKDNDLKIKELDDYWNSIKNSYEQTDDVSSKKSRN